MLQRLHPNPGENFRYDRKAARGARRIRQTLRQNLEEPIARQGYCTPAQVRTAAQRWGLWPVVSNWSDRPEILSVAGFAMRVGRGEQFASRNKTAPECNFLWACDTQALALLDDLDEVSCLDQ